MSELEWPNIVGRPLVGLPGATMARAPFWRPLALWRDSCLVKEGGATVD